MKKIFNNNKMMLLFIGVFVVVFGSVVNTIGKKTYSVEVCSDPMATLKDGVCIITRYVDCNSPSEETCRTQLPNDGFSCEHKSVTEEDGLYSHEFLCTKAAQTIVKVNKPECNDLTYSGIRQFLMDTSLSSGYTVSNNERTDAGSQDVTVKLKNGFVWSNDNSSSDYVRNCTIKKYQTDVSLEPGTSIDEAGSFVVTVDGGRLCPGKIRVSASDNMTSTNSYEISSDTSKTFSYTVIDFEKNGSLTIKYEPNDSNNCLSDTATFEYKYSSDNTVKKIAKPVCALDLEYDKNEKTLISNLENGYSLTIKDKNGTVISSPVDAGTYTVTASLNSRYTWLDDKKDDVEINCSIGQAKSSVSVSPTSGSGKVGYLTSTNASVSSKCEGTITLVTDGLEYTGTTSFPIEFKPSSTVRDLNFKVTRTCGKATATVKFKSSSPNCMDGSAVYTYNVNEGENCEVDINEKIEIPYDEVKCPENLIYDGKAKTIILPNDSRYTIRINNVSGIDKIQNVGTYVISAEINNPDDYSWIGTDDTKVILKTCTITSGSSTDKPSETITPISSIVLSNDSICINEQASLSISSIVAGKIEVTNSNNEIIKLSSSSYDLTANEEKTFKLLGLKVGSSNVKVRFIPTDSTKYEVIEKDYTVMVDNCGGNENVEKNPATGNIMLFIVWVIGFGAIGYSFYTFKASFKN